jgi:hypothetical protein
MILSSLNEHPPSDIHVLEIVFIFGSYSLYLTLLLRDAAQSSICFFFLRIVVSTEMNNFKLDQSFKGAIIPGFGHVPFKFPTSNSMPAPQYTYPDPTTQTEKNAFRTKGSSKYYDPCRPASQASMKCLDRNNYDKSKCQEAFDAYKECKRIWVCLGQWCSLTE